jgi:hypothetical protein
MPADHAQRKTVLILLLLSLVYFIVFIPPNLAASKNLEMVSVFEPDEAVPLPYVLNMIRPADGLKSALIQFAFYKYYFYGFPYFAYSAAWLLPLQWANLINDTSLVMLVLRQLVSLLPLLAAIWVLVFLQTRFKGYRAVLLFIFLSLLPAVVRNNFWWHPDGLAILFAMFAIIFLERDGLRFGRNFYLSAAMCGISAGTKGIGFYLFLTILVYLCMGWLLKKNTPLKLFLSAVCFLACMAAAYWLVNPTLIYAGVRERFFQVMFSQSQLLSQGYEVEYARGLSASLPMIFADYGSPFFIAATVYACILGMHRKRQKLLYAILFTWLIPLTLTVLFVIHYKFQYWLPVALPLFSSSVIFLPENIEIRKVPIGWWKQNWIRLSAMLIIGLQFIFNCVQDVNLYASRVNREKNSEAIQFNGHVDKALAPLPANRGYHVYYDVRMYVPARAEWYYESLFEMLDYAYVRSKNFDVILLRQQRIYDYLASGAVALNDEKMAASQIFYNEAQQGLITGYHLLYRDEYGLVFVRNRFFQNYFLPSPIT